jgi:hypothetical protein
LRVTVLSDPDAFEVFVGLVLLYFGVWLLYGVLPARGVLVAFSGQLGSVESSVRNSYAAHTDRSPIRSKTYPSNKGLPRTAVHTDVDSRSTGLR